MINRLENISNKNVTEITNRNVALIFLSYFVMFYLLTYFIIVLKFDD